MLLCVELLVGPYQASVSAHVIAVCCIRLINLLSQTYLGAPTITMSEERARRVRGRVAAPQPDDTSVPLEPND
jgi:hypothetical protein